MINKKYKKYKKTNKNNKLGNSEVLFEEIKTEQVEVKTLVSIEQKQREIALLQEQINQLNSEIKDIQKLK